MLGIFLYTMNGLRATNEMVKLSTTFFRSFSGTGKLMSAHGISHTSYHR